MTHTFQLSRTFETANDTTVTWEYEIVKSNSGIHHIGASSSGATHCNGRSGIYVSSVQKGGIWNIPPTAKLCKKCFPSNYRK